MHAESNATPSIEFDSAAANFVCFDLYLDSRLIMLSTLFILVLLLVLLFNKLLELLEIKLFLAISINEFILFIKFLTSLLILV